MDRDYNRFDESTCVEDVLTDNGGRGLRDLIGHGRSIGGASLEQSTRDDLWGETSSNYENHVPTSLDGVTVWSHTVLDDCQEGGFLFKIRHTFRDVFTYFVGSPTIGQSP